MAVDIVLSVNGKMPKFNPETSILFEDDADYWYLWSSMIKEIKTATGELIDLYGNAEFFGNNLSKVEKIVFNQLEELKQIKETQWEVCVGTQTKPIKKEIFKTLIKKDIEEKLQRFLSIIRQAKQTGEKVICCGD
jgi:K+ transporter